MSTTVNTKHDTTSYESCGYQRDISDGNALYDGMIRAKRGSDWKPQVQKFEMNYLFELSKMQRELRERTFDFLPTSEFILRERGKVRVVNGEQIHDRVAKHSLCDEVLIPSIKKYLIYDNGASLEGKGMDFTRKRLVTHLHKYYAQRGSNDGYILLMDFSKFYDNIRHEELLNIFRAHVHDDLALWLLEKTIERARIDVSYMTDEEYEGCLDALFNSLEYQKIDKNLLTGEKFMGKHMNIGDQVAQVAGVAYPMEIDNYVKIVKGVKYYARYMDDCYAIHESREFLEKLCEEITAIARNIGITVNERKTRICKLSEFWRFLQIQYSLTETGRVVQKINPKRLTAMRRKMKKMAHKLSEKDFHDWFYAWFKNHAKYMSKQQRENILTLFDQLKEVDKQCTRSNSQTELS